MSRDLVERAMAGDHDAFSRLAGAAIARLFGVARLILRDGEAAEDAVQECLVAAWRDLHSLRDPDRFDAWLHRLLVRSCYREAHRGQRRSVFEVHVDEIELGEPDGSHAIADRDELARAFRRLDEGQRAILVLHFYAGLPLVEVAAILRLPVGTVKSRLHRGMQAMRSELAAEARSVMAQEGRPV
jgi:RNA polymerase sigma factor (sigma-70 family)